MTTCLYLVLIDENHSMAEYGYNVCTGSVVTQIKAVTVSVHQLISLSASVQKHQPFAGFCSEHYKKSYFQSVKSARFRSPVN